MRVFGRQRQGRKETEAGEGRPCAALAHNPSRSRSAEPDSSRSTQPKTRKVVNFLWRGRSHRKRWWRSAAVLTCKLIVASGEGGERLIESPSSWFPLKFLSG